MINIKLDNKAIKELQEITGGGSSYPDIYINREVLTGSVKWGDFLKPGTKIRFDFSKLYSDNPDATLNDLITDIDFKSEGSKNFTSYNRGIIFKFSAIAKNCSDGNYVDYNWCGNEDTTCRLFNNHRFGVILSISEDISNLNLYLVNDQTEYCNLHATVDHLSDEYNVYQIFSLNSYDISELGLNTVLKNLPIFEVELPEILSSNGGYGDNYTHYEIDGYYINSLFKIYYSYQEEQNDFWPYYNPDSSNISTSEFNFLNNVVEIIK